MTKAQNKRPGRPALPASEKKIRNITFRSRGDMHERLAEAAALHERSISEEIESRLVRSLENDKYGEPSLHFRDSQFVDFLVGSNDASKDLIRKIADVLAQNPEWDGSKAGRKAMADKLHSYIYPPQVFEGQNNG